MSEHDNFLINLSVLYRNTQKYFDRVLSRYDIGSGQLIFLLLIYEHDGITMQEVTRLSEVDKGTTTKSISRLIEQGYVEARVDEKDRRVRRLHTTGKSADIMRDIYEYRARCRRILAREMDFAGFEENLAKVTDNSRMGLSEKSALEGLRIGALTKLTMTDVPGKAACRIDFAGCCFRCPWCFRKDMVFLSERRTSVDPEDVLAFLEKRRGILDAVCVSGGEPLMQEDLFPLLENIRRQGYAVHLETCGYEPEKLEELLRNGLADFVAMDVKNCRDRYAETAGVHAASIDLSRIERSLQILETAGIPYELRTTVMKEFHDAESLGALARELPANASWVLQNYKECETVIQPGYTPFAPEELEELCAELRKIIPGCAVRS